MKVTIAVLFFLLCASVAFGQASAGFSALSAQPVVIQMPSHPQRAAYTPLGQEENLSEKSTYTFAQGERPLWEVAPVNSEFSLGEVARALREEHLKARKATFIRAD